MSVVSVSRRLRSLLVLAMFALLGTASAQEIPPIPEVPREFRGVWAATLYNIDWPPTAGMSVPEMKKSMEELLDRAAETRLNAVILQIRPVGDAFYNSPFEPWSYFLTGTEGKAPAGGFDPLAFAVEEAHERGLELHAWMNPYRAKVGAQVKSSKHISKTRPDLIREYGGKLYLDPGLKEAQNYILNIVRDVVRRYDIDGMHYDDYFYPSPVPGVQFPDAEVYAQYTAEGGTLELADWRRMNTDDIIRKTQAIIRQEKSHVLFGVSPSGIWKNEHPAGTRGMQHYVDLYADSVKWMKEGWVDYLSPQLYWKSDRKGLEFNTLLPWWEEQNTSGRHLWPGLYTVQIGLAQWPVDEIIAQVKRAQNSPKSTGAIHYSEKALAKNMSGVRDALANGPYKFRALVPASPWLDKAPPPAPRLEAKKDGDTINFSLAPADATAPKVWVLHILRGDTWYYDIIPGGTKTFAVGGADAPTHAALTAVSRTGIESPRTLLNLSNGALSTLGN